MIKKVLFVVLAVAIAFGIAALIKKKKIEEAHLPKPKLYAVVVKTMVPRVSSFQLTLTALGVVESQKNVSISTKIPARVLYLKKLGDSVKKGEVIATLDSSSTQARIASVKSSMRSLHSKLSSAELALKNMLLTHRRTKELMKVNGASIEQYQKESNAIASLRSNIEAIKSQIESLKSTLKELETLLGYTVIRSPVDGIISRRFVNVGDVAAPGRPLMQIAASGSKYLLLRLPEKIKPIGIDFNGKFYRLSSLHSTFNGLDEYKADLHTALNAGSRVGVGVVVFKGKGVKLPMDTLLNDNGQNYVLVVKDEKAYRTPIEIVASGEEGVAVKGNIVGKRVVVAKPDILMKLLSGVQVVVKE